MKNLLVSIALGATLFSSAAVAQDDRGSRGGGWAQKDITREQARKMADALFQRLDANHDGTLTRQEAEQAAAQFGDRGIHMVDRLFGGAQSVTLQQAEAQALARFDAQDTNHDGVLSAAERQQMRAQHGAERGGPGQ